MVGWTDFIEKHVEWLPMAAKEMFPQAGFLALPDGQGAGPSQTPHVSPVDFPFNYACLEPVKSSGFDVYMQRDFQPANLLRLNDEFSFYQRGASFIIPYVGSL